MGLKEKGKKTSISVQAAGEERAREKMLQLQKEKEKRSRSVWGVCVCLCIAFTLIRMKEMLRFDFKIISNWFDCMRSDDAGKRMEAGLRW